MTKLNPPKNQLLSLLLIVAVAIAIVGGIVDLKNTIEYGGIDLRNRVVGARVLIQGEDPYFFKWNRGISEKLLDPSINPNSIVSRVTVPPTVLMLHVPIADLPFFTQRIIWLIVQWGSFLSILIIFTKRCNSSFKRNLMLILGWFFFNSLPWRHHVAVGQIYVIYTFLLSLSWFFSQSSFKVYHMLSGILLGVTASLRPPIILMLIPFLIFRKWIFFLGSIAGLIVSLTISLFINNAQIWKSYFLAVSGITKLSNIKKSSSAIVNQIKEVYPQTVEGVSKHQLIFDLPNYDSSFVNILNKVRFIGEMLNFPGMNFSNSHILVISLFFANLIMALFLFNLRYKNFSINLIFLSGILIGLSSEYFIPIPRYSYNDVQWILPLLMIIFQADMPRILNSKSNILLLFSLLSLIGTFNWMPFPQLKSYSIALYTTFMFLLTIKRDIDISKSQKKA